MARNAAQRGNWKLVAWWTVPYRFTSWDRLDTPEGLELVSDEVDSEPVVIPWSQVNTFLEHAAVESDLYSARMRRRFSHRYRLDGEE